MICFICQKEIEGDGVELSKRYHRYKHPACNAKTVCFVCMKPFKKKTPFKIGVNLFRHDKCEPGSHHWYKAFKDYLPPDMLNAYRFSKGEVSVDEESEHLPPPPELPKVVLKKRMK